MSKINQTRCDKCGNLIAHDWEQDHNAVEYSYMDKYDLTQRDKVDLCHTCFPPFKEMFTSCLGDIYGSQRRKTQILMGEEYP